MYDKERRALRVNKLFLAAYISREGEEQRTPVSLGRTFDISTTGVGMEVYQEVQVGSAMDMELDLHDSLFTVQGKVVHSRREGDDRYVIGVEFNEPQEQLAILPAD
jgi:c-di-GMP-binding flagellar brake protein YcgR